MENQHRHRAPQLDENPHDPHRVEREHASWASRPGGPGAPDSEVPHLTALVDQCAEAYARRIVKGSGARIDLHASRRLLTQHAWQKLVRYRGEGRLTAFLHAVLRNHVRRILRDDRRLLSRGRTHGEVGLEEAGVDPVQRPHHDPLEEAALHELETALHVEAAHNTLGQALLLLLQGHAETLVEACRLLSWNAREARRELVRRPDIRDLVRRHVLG